MTDYDVIIAGAGAAGLMCAIETGKRGRKVLVIEKGKKPAQKIRISGGGRCNFTNIHTLKIKNRASNGSTGTFAFEEDIANKVSTKNIEITSNGGGILLKSPDGSVTRRIGIDNSGNLVVE